MTTMSASSPDTESMVKIFIMGKAYEVPAGLTIMKAMEYSGYKFIRGVGCRGGFCGACATVYRLEGDYRLQVGLACQTVVEEGMYLAQVPFFPANKANYDIEELEPSLGALLQNYPELSRCLGCGTCSKVCPQDLQVMDYMQAAMRGDIRKVAELSFDCIMCGLCAARCPSETSQYRVALLARRLYARYLEPQAEHLADRIEEIEQGEFDEELQELMEMDKDQLAARYDARDIEPE